MRLLKLLTTLQKSFLTHKLFLGEALHLDCPVQRSDYACVNAKECPITFPIDMSNRFILEKYFTYVRLERVFGSCYGHVYTILPTTRSHEGNSCLPVKVKTVTCEKFELFLPIFFCHSEKEDRGEKKTLP